MGWILDRAGFAMKVTVERAQLLKSLGHVHRVVERRNTIPILGNVLIRAESARLSLKATDLDETTLRNLICGKLSIMVGNNCQSADYLAFDLESYDTFAEAAQVRTNKTAGGDLDTTGFGVHPGGPLTKNMLRVYYKWPVMTDIMARTMSDLPDGRKLLFATVTWQNEPF